MGIKNNHIYLYTVVIPPKYVVSKVVESIKKNTSRSISRKFTNGYKLLDNLPKTLII